MDRFCQAGNCQQFVPHLHHVLVEYLQLGFQHQPLVYHGRPHHLGLGQMHVLQDLVDHHLSVQLLRIPLPSNQGHLADLGLSLVFLFLSACWQQQHRLQYSSRRHSHQNKLTVFALHFFLLCYLIFKSTSSLR